jgi:hypothetical protein
MSSADPPKPKRQPQKSEGPPNFSPERHPTPANDAGVSASAADLDPDSRDRWAKLAFWTPEEAAYLTLGRKPPSEALIGHEAEPRPRIKDSTVKYRETLIERHLLGQERTAYISPLDAVQLMTRTEEWVQREMLEAVLNFHETKTQPSRRRSGLRLGDLLPDHFDDDDDDERPEALKRKLSTARKIILGFSMGKLGHKPGLFRNSTSKVLADIMENVGLPCDEDTIRRHLKAAKDEHWVDPDL